MLSNSLPLKFTYYRYIPFTLDHVLTTPFQFKNVARTGSVTMKQFLGFQVHTTSLLRPHHVLITSAPRPYCILHVSKYVSSLRAHQAHPVSTTSLRRLQKDQAAHNTPVLRFLHVLTVLYIIRPCIKCAQFNKQMTDGQRINRHSSLVHVVGH